MKSIFTFILLTFFFSSFGQLYNSSGSTIFVSNGDYLYTGINFVNDGTFQIGTTAGETGDLILNAGLDNVGGTLTMRDGVLHFGDGHLTNSLGDHNLIFNDFTNSQDQGSFVDDVKFVEFNKAGGTLTATGGQLGISESFTPAGGGTLNANDHIALVSTSFDNTAIVPESTGTTASVDGIRVQRFIPVKPYDANGLSQRAWHHLTVPVVPSGTINDDWQEGADPQNLSPGTPGDAVNPHPGYGMHITGTGDGFDTSTSSTASLFVYDAATETYSSPANTTTETLEHGKGYFVLVRGDRSTDLSFNDYATENTILQTTGALVIGNHNFNFPSPSSPSSDGWLLVGNPYQAPVNLTDVLNNSGITNIDINNMWAWDPKAGLQPYLGQYVNLDPIGGSATLPASNITNILQPGQSVFLKKSNPAQSAVIEFVEANKASTLTDIFEQNTQPIADGWLRFGLYQPTAIPLEDVAKDGFILKFDDAFSNAINQQDANKSFAYFENMAMMVDNTYLSKNARPLPTDLSESIPLYIENLQNGEYNFSVELENLSSNLPDGILLWDKYEDTYTELTDQLIIPFTVDTSIPESMATDRFSFVFENTTLGIEDYELNGVTLYPNPVVTNRLSIKFNEVVSDNSEVQIFDQMGKMVFNENFDNNGSKIEIDKLNFLSSGVYLLKVKQDRLEKTFKIIKR